MSFGLTACFAGNISIVHYYALLLVRTTPTGTGTPLSCSHIVSPVSTLVAWLLSHNLHSIVVLYLVRQLLSCRDPLATISVLNSRPGLSLPLIPSFHNK